MFWIKLGGRFWTNFGPTQKGQIGPEPNFKNAIFFQSTKHKRCVAPLQFAKNQTKQQVYMYECVYVLYTYPAMHPMIFPKESQAWIM